MMAEGIVPLPTVQNRQTTLSAYARLQAQIFWAGKIEPKMILIAGRLDDVRRVLHQIYGFLYLGNIEPFGREKFLGFFPI
jgi:hypothetical protein